jgi:hypothetical protein
MVLPRNHGRPWREAKTAPAALAAPVKLQMVTALVSLTNITRLLSGYSNHTHTATNSTTDAATLTPQEQPSRSSRLHRLNFIP